MPETLRGVDAARLERSCRLTDSIRFGAGAPGIERAAAARVYDDLVSTFTRSGAVDEETQRNDLVIIRQVVEGKEIIPPNRAYDFSFALDADQQLNKMGWKP